MRLSHKKRDRVKKNRLREIRSQVKTTVSFLDNTRTNSTHRLMK
jgi:hypothetical protein